MKPATDWKEEPAEGEAERLEALARQLVEVQRRASGGRDRALHAKGFGVEAELAVLPDLPAHARVGPFREPRTFRGYARFSNGSFARQPDRTQDIRGIAVKLLGVPGKKLIPGMEDATTQDLLAIQHRAVPFRDADEFVWFVDAASRSQALLLPRALVRFGPFRLAGILRAFSREMARPVVSFATTPFFSALPIRFGEHAARFAFFPREQAPASAKLPASPDGFAEDVAARLARGPIAYDLRVQLYADATRTPIEDPTVDWDESVSPFLTVARLTLPEQDVASERGRRIAALVETLSFDPWHAVEEMRPLGNLMRARNAAYRLSTMERRAAPEPTGDAPID